MAFQLDNSITQKKSEKEDNNIDKLLKKDITLFQNAFSNKTKEQFYTELSVLLNAGINLKVALELIESSQKKKPTKKIIEAIHKEIVLGKSLSEALKFHKQFTEYEFYSIKIGEETGTLAKVTAQLGEFYIKKNEQRKQLISALTYPVIILSTAILVVVFMLNFVVPMFQDMFKQQQVELPEITKAIINLSEFLKGNGWFIVLCCLTPFLLKLLLKDSHRYKKLRDTTLIKVPFLGKFIKTIYLAQFTQAVALLTTSKVPLINSIQLVKKMIDFYPLKHALSQIESHVLKGNSLSSGLKAHKLFDSKMVALVKVAEETNQTEYIFEKLNTQYTNQVQQQSKMLSTLLEPFIILFVGTMVGVILVAMYMPMFKLSSVL